MKSYRIINVSINIQFTVQVSLPFDSNQFPVKCMESC